MNQPQSFDRRPDFFTRWEPDARFGTLAFLTMSDSSDRVSREAASQITLAMRTGKAAWNCMPPFVRAAGQNLTLVENCRR
jgi:hypothetical protein